MKRSLLPAQIAVHQGDIAPPAPSPTSVNWQPSKAKKLTGAACEYCRKRRRRCNGDQPCSNCLTNNQTCVYEAQKTEKQRQDLKRKQAQIQEEQDGLKSLFSIIKQADPRKSLEIYGRIRSGQSPDTILKQMQHGDMLLQAKLNSERHSRQILLSSLMQTNASFDDVVDFIAISVAGTSNIQIPNASLFRQLRGNQTDLNTLRKLLGFPAAPQRRIAISDLLSGSDHVSPDTGESGDSESAVDEKSTMPMKPPFQVPAKPWTNLTDDDDLVSHLVSLYLEWTNPFFRCVEEDLFIQAMKSGDLNSDYCSPLLVNAVLALASLHSEREGAFFQTDDYMTRGQHFHDEAFRLWHLEDGRASLCNLQALCILFLNCVVRGKDKLGVNTCAVLTQLSRDVPITLTRPPASIPPTADEVATYQRVRKCAAWAAFACDMATANTILKPAFHTSCHLDFLAPSELPKLSTTWTGYPCRNKSTFLDKNAVFLASCKLNQLAWRAQNLLYASDRGDPRFLHYADTLAREMMDWKSNLPITLRYRSTLPGPVYDLYSCYYSVIIALYSLFQPLGDDQLPSPTNTQQPHKRVDSKDFGTQSHLTQMMRSRAILCAQEMAATMGHYRSLYGLKIIPPYMVQANGVACFTLLQDLDTTSSQLAFKEAFRCLLGAGMQLLWARGMARMLHLTAQNTGIELPKAITTMLAAVADTAWTKSDTEMLSSCWPNYVIAKEAKVGESVMMEDLIKKWEKLAVIQGSESEDSGSDGF